MSEWNEYSKLVLNELERLNGNFDKLSGEVADMRIEIALQKKDIGRSSGFISAITGGVVAIITALIINYVVEKEEVVVYKEDIRKKELIKKED